MSSEIVGGDRQRVVIFSRDNSVIGSGLILQIPIVVSPVASEGSFSVNVTNLIVSSADAERIQPVDVVAGEVTVVNPPMVASAGVDETGAVEFRFGGNDGDMYRVETSVRPGKLDIADDDYDQRRNGRIYRCGFVNSRPAILPVGAVGSGVMVDLFSKVGVFGGLLLIGVCSVFGAPEIKIGDVDVDQAATVLDLVIINDHLQGNFHASSGIGVCRRCKPGWIHYGYRCRPSWWTRSSK